MKSEAQILLERKAWARGQFLVAWLKLSQAVGRKNLTLSQLRELETECDAARAIAAEWGIDCETVVAEAEAAV